MKCKTCGDKGMLLKPKKISENEFALEVVTCDCCGGWSRDGIDCENCLADAEEKSRRIVWVNEEDYLQAMEEYRRKLEEEEGS